MRFFLVCFDISDNNIRERVGKRLNACGERVQESVFEVELRHDRDLEDLQQELLEWLQAEDDLRFYPLCGNCRLHARDVHGRRVAKLPSIAVV